MKKPELLLPVGHTESLFAAIEAGADAVYLGLDDFNARKRAKNFVITQLPTVISLAHKQGVKVFITLNTVIKNTELAGIYKLLFQLNQLNPDAVIVQDWGVYYLLKENFPNIPIHSSTQAVFHNSVGMAFAQKAGIKRVVLARELTQSELNVICSNSKTETEVFVHGALCYSFSGLCLFSSYLGGMSANRGSCKQVCRRQFSIDSEKQFPFNLKDNQLISFVAELMKMGVSSLKIEGRLKPAENVYNVGRAYRMVLDNPDKIIEAQDLLSRDIGREKTTYFFGGNLSSVITNVPNTGLFSGVIEMKIQGAFEFDSSFDAREIAKLRISSPDGNRQATLQLKSFEQNGKRVKVNCTDIHFEQGDYIYITGFKTKKFPELLPEIKAGPIGFPTPNEIKIKAQNLVKPGRTYQPRLFIRIDSLEWLKYMDASMAGFFILNLPKKEWSMLPEAQERLNDFSGKLIPQLPTFISEENLSFYRQIIRELQQKGIDSFVTSHISQVELFQEPAKLIAGESIYVFNDAAVMQLRKFGFSGHICPLENDYRNLMSGNDRSSIIPLYFKPVLFYSRMPASGLQQHEKFADDEKTQYQIVKQDGLSLTVPVQPVSLFAERKRLAEKGFVRYLIDFSFHKPDKKVVDEILRKYYNEEKVPGSGSFNFRRELS